MCIECAMIRANISRYCAGAVETVPECPKMRPFVWTYTAKHVGRSKATYMHQASLAWLECDESLCSRRTGPMDVHGSLTSVAGNFVGKAKLQIQLRTAAVKLFGLTQWVTMPALVW